MSSRLYYDSVQLNHVTQQHADVLRCDVIAEPIKHFNAECKYLLFAHIVLHLTSVHASFIQPKTFVYFTLLSAVTDVT